MRLLNFSQWLELFNKVFINLMILLNRIEVWLYLIPHIFIFIEIVKIVLHL